MERSTPRPEPKINIPEIDRKQMKSNIKKLKTWWCKLCLECGDGAALMLISTIYAIHRIYGTRSRDYFKLDVVDWRFCFSKNSFEGKKGQIMTAG